jgi:quercetin dioxygenase-like cupin family protein
MTTKLQHSKPKTLAPGEGDTHPMLTHTLVWKLTGGDTNGQYAIFEMIDTAGGEAPLHSHPWEETFYILEGEIEIQVGNRQQIVSAGAMSHVPANTAHRFQVRSPIARALHIVSPASAAAFYQEVGTAITSFPPDLIVFQEICVKHGLQLLGGKS